MNGTNTEMDWSEWIEKPRVFSYVALVKRRVYLES